MKQIFRKLHLWLSLPFGIVITITCFTGALLVFEDEITAACTSYMTKVSPEGVPLSVDEVVKRVESTLSDGAQVTGVTIFPSPERAYKATLSKPQRASVYVNQYTGEVLGRYGRLPFFGTTFRLHRWLLDSNPGGGAIFWGKRIVGISTLSFVVILLTGLVIWWPRNRKMLKNRLAVAVTKGKNRFWYDLHVAGGFYVMLVLLSLALTGLTWSFQWYRNGVNSIFAVDGQGNGGGKNVQQRGKAHGGKAEGEMTDLASARSTAPWQEAVDAVIAENPGYAQLTVSKGSISVDNGSWGNMRASDSYDFNPVTGEAGVVQRYGDMANRRSKLNGWIYTIHVGAWGGLFSKIVTFLAAILGATLPLTGYWLWIRRLYGKKKKA